MFLIETLWEPLGDYSVWCQEIKQQSPYKSRFHCWSNQTDLIQISEVILFPSTEDPALFLDFSSSSISFCVLYTVVSILVKKLFSFLPPVTYNFGLIQFVKTIHSKFSGDVEMHLKIKYILQQQNVSLPYYVYSSKSRNQCHSHSNWPSKAKTRI